MAKLVKFTSNIDLDLLAAVFYLRSWNIYVNRIQHLFLILSILVYQMLKSVKNAKGTHFDGLWVHLRSPGGMVWYGM